MGEAVGISCLRKVGFVMGGEIGRKMDLDL